MNLFWKIYVRTNSGSFEIKKKTDKIDGVVPPVDLVYIINYHLFSFAIQNVLSFPNRFYPE